MEVAAEDAYSEHTSMHEDGGRIWDGEEQSVMEVEARAGEVHSEHRSQEERGMEEGQFRKMSRNMRRHYTNRFNKQRRMQLSRTTND